MDEHALLRKTNELGDPCVLGVLCYAAHLRNPHAKLDWVCRRCPPNAQLVPFFHRVARSPLASRLARENPVEAFRKWNCLSDRPAKAMGVESHAEGS